MKKISTVRIQNSVRFGAAVVVAILAPPSLAHTRTTDVTWIKDVQPILQSRCATCHSPGGSAQVSLVTYRDAQAKAREIREEILEGRMPPWPAARGVGDFRNDRSLTPLEIELLTAWADGNAPLGNVDARSTTPPSIPSSASASVLSITLPTGRPVRSVERLVADTNNLSPNWITGWTFRPGDPTLVERAVVSIGGEMLGSWTSGDAPVHFPTGVAQRIHAGAQVDIEMHYRKSTATVMPASVVDLYLGPRPQSALEHRVLACGSNLLTGRIAALAVTPLAPAAGESVEIIARHPDGSVKPVVVIPDFDPANQLTYRLRTPIQLPHGSTIQVRSSSPNCGAALEFIGQPARALERSR